MRKYEKFDLIEVAKLGENYITSMVDEKMDYLPYWYVQINENPAYARHVRVDDAELVASWYEAIVCTRKILGDKQSPKAKAVEDGFLRHLKKSWGEHGFRFNEPYPWSNITHSSFHELGWVLAGLNRAIGENPDDKELTMRAEALIDGLLDVAYARKTKTFWNGDYDFDEDIFEFPSDLYIKGEGFVPERVTGRGEASIRNSVLLQPLVIYYEKHGYEPALKLAKGIANFTLGLSRYFNYKGEFFGHVHSTLWFAMGLTRLGRILNDNFYIEKAYSIYSYVKSLSSEYGWVPEYAQWFPMSESHCETCCIRDMIECALELIDAGYDEWDVVDKYTRNQLSEQQVKDGSFISVDNTRENEFDRTYTDIDKRVVGGWSGGGEANSISVTKFRSIAGCCVGTAPQALYAVWKRIAVRDGGKLFVNLPIEMENSNAKVEIGYPNNGFVKVSVKSDCDVYIRVYDYMGTAIEVLKNGKNMPLVYSEGCVLVAEAKTGDMVEIRHALETRMHIETVQEKEYHVYWRASDVIKIEPEGDHVRLYQRELGKAKVYPPKIGSSETISLAPTNQKK